MLSNGERKGASGFLELSAWRCRRVYALLQRLGARSVFNDVTAISPGEDYTVAIDRALVDCDAALVVIGPGWLPVTSPQGARRLFEPSGRPWNCTTKPGMNDVKGCSDGCGASQPCQALDVAAGWLPE